MGIAASQARLTMITARQSDLEFQMQSISQQRSVLALQAAQSQDTNSSQSAQLQAVDKQLESKMLQLQTQQKMVNTEYDSVKKTMDDSITRSFKTLA
ncbi:MAG: hypothetical protein WCG23_06175 [bacterium]